MSARDDFSTALRIDLLVSRTAPVGLTDERDLGWTGRYSAIDTSAIVTFKRTGEIAALPADEAYVSAPFEGRPDLIADEIYGLATLAWILRIANDLRRAEDFVTGTVLRVPKRRDVEALFLSANR